MADELDKLPLIKVEDELLAILSEVDNNYLVSIVFWVSVGDVRELIDLLIFGG